MADPILPVDLNPPLVDPGRSAVDDLFIGLDARHEVLWDMIIAAHLGVAMNHAMLMSSCIFCDEELVPPFAEMTPEVGFHISLLFKLVFLVGVVGE